MSLLIKALNKAEDTKSSAQAENTKTDLKLDVEPTSKRQNKADIAKISANDLDTELSLSPVNSAISKGDIKPNAPVKTSASYVPVQVSTSSAQAKSAANVFSAKGLEDKTDSARLAMIAGAGLIALLGMGLYFYQFVDNAPPIVVPQRPLEQTSAAPPAEETQQAEAQINGGDVAAEPSNSAPMVDEPAIPPAIELAEAKPTMPRKKADKAAMVDEDDAVASLEDSPETASEAPQDKEALDESALADNEDNLNRLQASFSANKTNKKTRKSKNNLTRNNSAIASESASINVTKSTAQPSMNPLLTSAYEAYNAGNDTQAQQLYKQVLKRDIHNVDALLGLGAIAARQGRAADANGWYGKVLELEPHNNIAQAAILDSQSQGNEQNNETRLKSMLAKQPDDANLHVALGNLYAEQNQWPAAQQAYFDAYRLNKTADNAFNLAVSLDQMGKPKLALSYYQQALTQASDTSGINKAALSARIAAIQ